MAPLSVIPGRVRLESRKLIGSMYSCGYLTNKINAIEGVIKTDINPRTGRILVIFDNSRISSEDIITDIKNMLDSMEKVEPPARTWYDAPPVMHGMNGNDKGTGNAFIHAAIDIAGHVLLPKPFGVLLPIAIHAVRKNL